MEEEMERGVRLLGGFGSFLIVLSIVPYVGGLFALVGLILLSLAIKKFAEAEGRRELFSTFLKGILIYMVGSLVGLLLGLGGLSSAASGEGGLLAYFLTFVGFLVVYASGIVGTYFMKEVFREVALSTGNGLFDWGGKFLFWGALLTVILIGALITWVGWILITVAFFTTEDNLMEH